MVSTHAHSKNGLVTRRPGQKLNKLKNIWNNISPAGCRISESFRVEYHRNIFIDLATSTSDLLHPPVLGYLEVSIVTGVPQKRWFMRENLNVKWMITPMTQRTPHLGIVSFFPKRFATQLFVPLKSETMGPHGPMRSSPRCSERWWWPHHGQFPEQTRSVKCAKQK